MGERRRPNVILLVIDTLREDHAGGLEALRDLGKAHEGPLLLNGPGPAGPR